MKYRHSVKVGYFTIFIGYIFPNDRTIFIYFSKKISDMNGAEYHISVYPTDTILDLKHLLAEKVRALTFGLYRTVIGDCHHF